MTDQEIIDAFHKLYYDKHRCFQRLSFLGVYTVKFPNDLLIYAEILYEKRPDIVIECGTHAGGSALFMATIMDAIGHGRILTIDPHDLKCRPHPRITYLRGSSVDSRVTHRVFSETTNKTRMVILDSDHSRAHVAKELETYGSWVTPGQYLIVEDTNINGHPVSIEHGPGPMEAVQEFLAGPAGQAFEVDRGREKFLLTACPSGFLLRKG